MVATSQPLAAVPINGLSVGSRHPIRRTRLSGQRNGGLLLKKNRAAAAPIRRSPAQIFSCG